MSDGTLKQKIHDYCQGHVQFGSLFTDVLSIIADHVDWNRTHLNELGHTVDGLVKQCDREGQALSARVDKIAIRLTDERDELSARIDKLEREMPIALGVDVPSSEGVDLEGESMSADYNALRDDAEDVEDYILGLMAEEEKAKASEIKRVPTKVTCRLECLQCNGKDEQCVFCGGSGLIDMVDVKSAERELEEAFRKNMEEPEASTISEYTPNTGLSSDEIWKMRIKKDEPDRPWREAAEACCKELCISTDPKISTGAKEHVRCVESAIEKAVGQAADSVFSVCQSNQKLVEERDALKAEVERLNTQVATSVEIIHQRIVELTDALGVDRHALHWDSAILRVQELKAGVAELKHELKETEDSHRDIHDKYEEMMADRNAVQSECEPLRAEVNRLKDDSRRLHKKIKSLHEVKAAKPKVVRLSRNEIAECLRFRGVPGGVHWGASVDAILALQERKAAEAGGGAE